HYFVPGFGTEEYFHRINRVMPGIAPKLKYTDNLDYGGMNWCHEYLEPELVYMHHFGWTEAKRVLDAKLPMWDPTCAQEWKEKWKEELLGGKKPNGNKNYHLFAQKLGYGNKFLDFDPKLYPPNVLEMIKCEH